MFLTRRPSRARGMLPPPAPFDTPALPESASALPHGERMMLMQCQEIARVCGFTADRRGEDHLSFHWYDAPLLVRMALTPRGGGLSFGVDVELTAGDDSGARAAALLNQLHRAVPAMAGLTVTPAPRGAALSLWTGPHAARSGLLRLIEEIESARRAAAGAQAGA